MRRTWWVGLMTGLAAALVVLGFAQSLRAQVGGTPPTGRIACVDVVQVFNEFQRQKDLTEEMRELQDRLNEENKQRRQKIDALQAEIDKLDPDDPAYVTRMREMLAMQIDYKNWVDLKQADMSREVGVWSVRIYREILKAVEELARRRGALQAVAKRLGGVQDSNSVARRPGDVASQRYAPGRRSTAAWSSERSR